MVLALVWVRLMTEKSLLLPEIKPRFSNRPVRSVVSTVTAIEYVLRRLPLPSPTEVSNNNNNNNKNNLFSVSNEVPSVPECRAVEIVSERAASNLRYQQTTFT
jgi:hypothetical protein